MMIKTYRFKFSINVRRSFFLIGLNRHSRRTPLGEIMKYDLFRAGVAKLLKETTRAEAIDTTTGFFEVYYKARKILQEEINVLVNEGMDAKLKSIKFD